MVARRAGEPRRRVHRTAHGRRRAPRALRSPLLTLAWLDWRNLVSDHVSHVDAVARPARAARAARGAGVRTTLVGFAFLFVAFSQSIAQLGMFGRDGRGMRTLLVLPLELRALLVAKLLTGLLYHAITAGLVTLVLALAIRPAPSLLLAGWLFSWFAFFTYVAIGQRTSAWMPRPITRGARSNPLALPVVLLSLFTALGLAGLALALWFADLRLGGGYLPLFAAALAVLGAVGCWAQLGPAARFVEARRDLLLRVSE